MKLNKIIFISIFAAVGIFGISFLVFSQTEEPANSLQDIFPRPVKVVVDEEANFAYVLNELKSSLSVLDVARKTYLRMIVLPNLTPKDLAINQQTKKIYVVTANGQLNVIDGKRLVENPTGDFDPILKTVQLSPGLLSAALNEKTNRLYIINSLNDEVSVINGGTDSEEAKVKVGRSPQSIILNSETNKIYVPSFINKNISVIDGKDNSVKTISLAGSPYDVQVNPKTNKIYAVCPYEGKIFVIDGRTEKVLSEIPLETAVFLEVNPEVNKIYAIRFGFDGAASFVVAIDGKTDQVIGTLELPPGSCPVKLAVAIKTDKIYIPLLYHNKVAVIDSKNLSLEKLIPSGVNPSGATVNKKTGEVFVLSPEGHSTMVIDENNNVSATFSSEPESVKPEDFFPTGEKFGCPSKFELIPEKGKLLVLNRANKKLAVVNLKTNKAEETFLVGNNPREVYYDSPAKKIFVTNGNDKTVTVIDYKTKKTVTLQVGEKPWAIVPILNSQGQGAEKIYIINFVSKNISVIDVQTLTVKKTIEGIGAMALAGVFDKKTGLAYVINYMEGTISVIDAKKDELINTLKAGKFLRVISKTDDSIYAADKDNVYSVNKDGLKEVMKLDSNGPIVDIVSYNDKIYLAQLLLNKVIVLRAGTYQKITELNVGSVYYNFQIGPGPEKMALNQKYQKLYVLHPITGSISVIDLKNDSVLETILIPQQFRGLRQMFYNEDGEKLYVAACDTNNVAIIDGKTNKLVGPISPEEKAGLEKKLASSNLIVLIGIGIGIIIIITLFYFLIVRKK